MGNLLCILPSENRREIKLLSVADPELYWPLGED